MLRVSLAFSRSDGKLTTDCYFQDGDGSIPTQEVGTALRAMGTYPSVGNMQGLYFSDLLRILGGWSLSDVQGCGECGF